MSLVYHHLSRPSQKVLYSQGTHHSVWKSPRGNLWKMRLLGDFQPLWAPLEREAGKAIKSGRHGSWATTIWHLLRVPNQRPFSSKKAKEKMCTGWFSSSPHLSFFFEHPVGTFIVINVLYVFPAPTISFSWVWTDEEHFWAFYVGFLGHLADHFPASQECHIQAAELVNHSSDTSSSNFQDQRRIWVVSS